MVSRKIFRTSSKTIILLMEVINVYNVKYTNRFVCLLSEHIDPNTLDLRCAAFNSNCLHTIAYDSLPKPFIVKSIT